MLRKSDMLKWLGSEDKMPIKNKKVVNRGNVVDRNSVFYFYGPDVSYNPPRYVYHRVEVLKVGKERVTIRWPWGSKGCVSPDNLIKGDVISSKSILVCPPFSENKIFVIKDSVCVRKSNEGEFYVEAFVLNFNETQMLAKFSGVGKLNKAKKFQRDILSDII